MKKRTKKTLIWVTSILLGVFLALASVVSYAYFSKKEIYDGYISGKIELLFDRLDAADKDAYYTGYDSTADWGSKENPYVISKVRHLYNLSELQQLGYFYDQYISQNQAGSYDNIPYFLVCTPDYKPVLIDGSDFKDIAPIGTNKFPFIGSISGVKNTDAAVEINGEEGEENKTYSDTSVLANIKVSGNPSEPDVGLFGYIGFLGDPSNDKDEDGYFPGQVSTVSNLVLSDVQITVDNSLWTTFTGFIDDIAKNAAGHRYSFTDLNGGNYYDSVPHENHHIGILTGHVSYSIVEYISVYYSDNDVIAIDLYDAFSVGNDKANYRSDTGILGFAYNMNPEFLEEEGEIGVGSGTMSSNLSLNTGGAGTGGGSLSGTGRGYVTASEMYTSYRYTNFNDKNGQPVWEYIVEGGRSKLGILVYKYDGYYYLDEDKKTNVTVADGTVTLNGNTWSDYMVAVATSGTGTADNPVYTYYDKDEKTKVTFFEQRELLIKDGVNDKGELLCTEWIRDRILWGTQATGRYYFYDGVFTFALSTQDDVIEDTWDNNTPDSIVLGANDNGAWEQTVRGGYYNVSAKLKQITDVSQINEKNEYIILYKDDAGNAHPISLNGLGNNNTGESGRNAYTVKAGSGTIKGIDENYSDDVTINNGNGSFTDIYWSDFTATDQLYFPQTDAVNNLIAQYSVTFEKQTNNTWWLRGTYYTDDDPNNHNKNKNYLRLLYRLVNNVSPYRSFYSCPDYYAVEGNFGDPDQLISAKNATITFNTETGSAKIQYTVGNVVSYSPGLNYDSEYGFNTPEPKNFLSNEYNDPTPLYIYEVVRWVEDLTGKVVFTPKENETEDENYTEPVTLPADEYVLCPNVTYAGSASRANGTVPSYTAIELSQLYVWFKEEEDGWINKVGQQPLSRTDLHKKFRMIGEMAFGAMLNLFNGSLDLGDGQLVAPVGSNGVNANIPMGCVAFRINSNETSKIRVIVSVPVSDYYEGETDAGSYFDDLYYFGVWKAEEAGQSIIQTFSKDNTIEKFELPRSHPYAPNAASGDSEYIYVTYNGQTYRCYLNGDTILVAYEFEVTGEGVYILGNTNGPMEIVYFSADHTASAGQDGTAGSKLGSIDFVYDYNNKIVTVSDTKATVNGEAGDNTEATDDEDYNNYYASLCLMYTDNAVKDGNEFRDINDLQITIRRSIVTSQDGTKQSTLLGIAVKATNADDAKYLRLESYALTSDAIVREDDAARPKPNGTE